MEVGICTSFVPGMPFETAIPLIAEAGFTATSLGGVPALAGYDTAENRRKLEKLLREYHLGIDSVHAPFPDGDRLFSEDEAERLHSLECGRLALDAAAELDGKVVVIHLIQPYGVPPGEKRDRMIEHGRRSVASLAEYSARRKVKLALENGQHLEYDQVLFQLLEEFQVSHVGLCYDSGHENVQGTCFEILERYGSRLMALHLHDNLGTDTHLLPFEGNIDWEKFRMVMRKLAYPKALILESSQQRSAFQDSKEFLREAKIRIERLQP